MIYEEQEYCLQKGDRLFLYTDGAYEIIDPDNNLLGIRNLCGILSDESRLDLSDMLTNTMNKLEKFRGSSPVMDDVVLIGFEVVG